MIGRLLLPSRAFLQNQRIKKIFSFRTFTGIPLNELNEKFFINNIFVTPKSKKVFKVYSPYDNSEFAKCGSAGIEDTVDAIEAADCAFSHWKDRSNDRAKFLLALSKKLTDYKELLASCITSEMGKPLSESRTEVESSIKLCEWNSEECKRIYGEFLISGPTNKRQFVLKQPHGVVGLITPWNFPLNMIVRSLSAALAAGCTLVLKPSSDTPITALLLAKIIQECDFPPGVVNVVTSDPKDSSSVGYTLCKDVRVRHISFTGSTEVGTNLMCHSAASVKRLSMELGGNAPFIVFSDADIENAIKCLKLAKFRNCGQTCISANRIFVQREIGKEFVEKIVHLVKNLIIGSPFDETTEISCLYSKKGADKVRELVNSSIQEGAVVEFQTPDNTSCGQSFYPPSVLTNCNPFMSVINTEVFGPILSVIPFDTDSQAIDLANSTPYGLACYLYSKDMSRIFKAINALNFGLVAVNDSSPSYHTLPFGGLKTSGVGSEMGSYGIRQYMDNKSITISL